MSEGFGVKGFGSGPMRCTLVVAVVNSCWGFPDAVMLREKDFDFIDLNCGE